MNHSTRLGLALGCLLIGNPGISQAPEAAVKLQVVKYAGLAETVSKLKGKVVVVDFWADF
ncbi:MAG: hypothetical protein JNM56_09185 [Planctomycetia bacterium]|nr:hypothetical protein [Planctomycetia bacterium]